MSPCPRKRGMEARDFSRVRLHGVNRYENVLDVVGLNSYNRPSVKEDWKIRL